MSVSLNDSGITANFIFSFLADCVNTRLKFIGLFVLQELINAAFTFFVNPPV